VISTSGEHHPCLGCADFVLVLSPVEESPDSVAENKAIPCALTHQSGYFCPISTQLLQGVSAPRDEFADMTKTSELIPGNVHSWVATNQLAISLRNSILRVS
jgi:hypothetical protein